MIDSGAVLNERDTKIMLAIDTATEFLSMAVGSADILLSVRHFRAYRSHQALILPAVIDVLGEAGFELDEIDTVAVGIGPGSFTGTRIGVAVARALSQGSGKPLVGMSSLDLLAVPFADRELVCPVIDAKRGEVYTANFRFGERVGDYRARTPEALAAEVAATSARALFVGDALERYGTTFNEMLGDSFKMAGKDYWYPLAENLIAIAARQPPSGIVKENILPIYIRLSDAEEALRQRTVS